MTAADQAALLAGSHKLQLATINRDGTPHLVTMFYVMLDGQIAFWTYRKSQKARNLERDPRISCLVEAGDQYFDLRGVLVQGTARRIEDPRAILDVGRRVSAVLAEQGGAGSAPAGSVTEYLEHAARNVRRFLESAPEKLHNVVPLATRR